METHRKWSAEQISVPQDLGGILKAFTKEVIRERVDEENLLQWSANYFAKLANKTSLPFVYNPETKRYEKDDGFPEELQSKESSGVIQPVVIVGPSGVGKSTIIQEFMNRHPNFFQFAVSHTSRPPREGEQHGVDYYFTTLDDMMDRIGDGEFVEYAEVHGNVYGTSLEELNRIMKSGSLPLLDIDVQGARIIRENENIDPIYIFIAPPSMEDLEERLRGRGSEDDDTIARRLKTAVEEIEASKEPDFFDHVFVNESVEQSVRKLGEVLGMS